jgi:hypothetical protein
MRTKTVVLSALLGVLGSASLMAQSTNVYSLNAVGYINVTVLPGFNQISCPLIASPDNTVGTVLNNGSGVYNGSAVYFWSPATASYSQDSATTNPKFNNGNTNGWVSGGTNVLAPGVACFFQNTGLTNITITFVGTVPQGSLTNTLVAGFNLVSTIVPTSGDIVTNPLTLLTNYNIGDSVYVYSPTTSSYTEYTSGTGKFAGYGYDGNWTAAGDPIITNVGQGFWYDNSGATVTWVENFSVNP